MKARLKRTVEVLSETFWVIPGLMTFAGIILALGLVHIDGTILPAWLLQSSWLYNGGSTGARTLLGAVASSTVGVAGTVFSITIAALSLAAGQMGPRLLRNFTKDPGNQITLGAFLGTFSYSLMVLRTVRSEEEGAFVPHLSLSRHHPGLCVCVCVSARDAAEPVADGRRGYLQQLDAPGLAKWAVEKGASVLLLVRPGGYFPLGAPIAFIKPKVEGAEAAIRNAVAQQTSGLPSGSLSKSQSVRCRRASTTPSRRSPLLLALAQRSATLFRCICPRVW